MDHFRDRLARSAIQQVEKHGWTAEAITAAAVQDPKLSLSMAGMLTPTELIHWFMDDMNRQLSQKIQQDREDPSSTAAATDNNKLIFDSIQWRLHHVVPLVRCGQWHKGMALGLSTPLTTQQQLHEFIEILSPPGASIQYQTALGGIFVATELHLLTDSSPNYQDTWTFLQSALDELDKHKNDQTAGTPSQILSSLLLSLPPKNMNPIDSSIPLMASMAVASSLMEGVASLILPHGTNGSSSSSSVPGTQSSDYQFNSKP